MFANGGKKVSNYLIESITSINTDEHPALNAQPCTTPCEPRVNEQVIDPRIAFIMNSILKDTIQKGTGRKAFKALGREDLMGKTGTTNDADIWFSGYNADIAATAWAGFSSNAPVGNREWGSTTPIETWIEFAKAALPTATTNAIVVPDGIVSIKIDPETGKRAGPSDPNGIFEYFRVEFAPEQIDNSGPVDQATQYQDIF